MANDDRKEEILEALSTLVEPSSKKDIVSLGLVQNLRVCGDTATFQLELPPAMASAQEQMRQLCQEEVEKLDGIEKVNIQIASSSGSPSPQKPQPSNLLPGVKFTLAVGSGKGGVGKSTVATNLAVSLAQKGFKVGLLDSDVYGPSLPLMLGVDTEPHMTLQGKLVPVEAQGLKAMSVGLLSQEEAPLIWRGPMATQLIQQFLGKVEWGELDFLVIDLPPGTGDIQITLCQKLPLSGAVIVTTPQDMTFTIARKALNMFKRLNVEIIGLVENMSGYTCGHCGKGVDIFPGGNMAEFCEKESLPLLAKIPLETHVVEESDRGTPFVTASPESTAAQAMEKLAESVVEESRRQEDAQKRESARIVPAQIEKPTPFEIEIEWTDESVSRYDARDLRAACTCATCVDEWTGEPRLDASKIPNDIKALKIETVGNYALSFQWSDGHSTGIYTYEYLRKLSLSQAESEQGSFEI